MTRVGAVNSGTVRARVPGIACRRLSSSSFGGALTSWRRVVAAVVVVASVAGVLGFSPTPSLGRSGLTQAAGVTEYMTRSFDNSSRVWLQEDSFAGTQGVASSLNRYAFVQGSPVTFTDVWGFFRSAADVDAFMAVNDPNKGKPLSHVIRDWAEDHPGTVTGMVTGFAFGAACTIATAGAGLLACAAMGGALSSAIGSSIDYVDQTPASERNWGDYLTQVGKDAAIGAALGVAGEGFGVVLQGAAKPLLTNATRAFTNTFTDVAAAGVDDAAKVTWRSTWDDVVEGVSGTWNAKVPFKPRVTNDAPTTSPNTVVGPRTSGAPEAGGSNFMAEGDAFAQNAAKAEPLAGYHDVVVHGSATDFGATPDAWATGANFSHRVLADLIRRDPAYTGGPVRLLSCNTASCGATAAQDLANSLGVEVYAPTDTLWAYPSGELVVGPSPTVPTGGWVSRFPGGSS